MDTDYLGILRDSDFRSDRRTGRTVDDPEGPSLIEFQKMHGTSTPVRRRYGRAERITVGPAPEHIHHATDARNLIAGQALWLSDCTRA